MRKLGLVALFGAVLFVPHIVLAQPQTSGPATVPEAMPFDIPYGTPIALEDADKAIIAAVTEARKHNWKMSISVVDPAGMLIAHATMDGTQYGSIAFSQAKARTAALFRRPSKAFADAINGSANGAPSPATLTVLGPVQGAASEGGFPIVKDGKLIGAIGASGGIATQDGMTAKAGLAALGVPAP
jgi:glc operon protein GlcG